MKILFNYISIDDEKCIGLVQADFVDYCEGKFCIYLFNGEFWYEYPISEGHAKDIMRTLLTEGYINLLGHLFYEREYDHQED